MKSRIIVGRNPGADIRVPDEHKKVSGQHLVVEERNGTYSIMDPGSSNGTTLNGRRLKNNEYYQIRSEDSITLGGVYQLPWSRIDDVFKSTQPRTHKEDYAQSSYSPTEKHPVVDHEYVSDLKITIEDFSNALISFLFLYFIYPLFIMPWNIWLGSIKRLSELRQGEGIVANLRLSEFTVLNYFKISFDLLIFIVYLIGPIIAVFAGIFNFPTRAFPVSGFGSFIFVLLTVYFLPVLFSFLKELFSLSLILVLKLEEISKNTKHLRK